MKIPVELIQKAVKGIKVKDAHTELLKNGLLFSFKDASDDRKYKIIAFEVFDAQEDITE